MKKAREYSKKVISAMIIMWFLGAVFGAVVIIVELIAALGGNDSYTYSLTVHLPELLAYLGAPVTGGIVGYLIKSATENREKIKKSAKDTQNEDIP